jgi:alkanesulfonate monooxygenase SsuD/methylene tetrahydromethanopterin reductase-like flavin-dependent oxidoreductase (luciferase family)
MIDLCRRTQVDGIWVGDHVVLGGKAEPHYPYKPGGKFFLQSTDDWYEAFVCLGYIAALAGDLELGTGVALPLLRPPALLAKQVATLSRLAQGDVLFGVGLGWLQSEYEAVGVPWAKRGERLDACVQVIREYWKGSPEPGQYGPYEIPEALGSNPIPRQEIPILFGGNSEPALKRAARRGDGWLGAVSEWTNDSVEFEMYVDNFLSEWNELHELTERPILGTVQAVPSWISKSADFENKLSDKLGAYREKGLSRVVFNVSWNDLVRTEEIIGTIRQVMSNL